MPPVGSWSSRSSASSSLRASRTDGIGPEISAATVDVLAALDETLSLGLELEQAEIGLTALAEHDTTRPKGVQEKVAQADGAILGPVSHYECPPRNEGGINPSAELRTRFELFANIRPCRSVEGLSILRSSMDLVIDRENTEGF
jgi:isocitrate/isopropylmalate dehydrogenase